MVRKILLLLLICIFGFLLWIRAGSSNEIPKPLSVQTSPELKSPLHNSHKKNVIEKVEKATSKTKVSPEIIAEEKVDALMAEIEIRHFSDDPIVEVESLMYANIQCTDNFNPRSFYGAQMSEKALTQVEKAQVNCAAFKKQYPSLSSEVRVEKLLNQLVPTSRYSQLRQELYSNDSSTLNGVDLYFSALKTESGPVIAFAGYLSLFGMPLSYEHELYKILKTEDHTYMYAVLNLASHKLSCSFQDGVSCSENSFYMLQQCAEDDDFCGIDFETWFQLVTMPGQRKDVEIVLVYLKQVSE